MRKQKNANSRYEIGYRRPPTQFQFQRGQSGNPTGKNRTAPSIAEDLRASLIPALYKRVDEYVKGDRQALRDVILLLENLGIDLAAGEGKRTDRDGNNLSEAELRQLLIERGIPARMLPPIDEAGSEPPPDPPLPPDVEDE